MDILKSALRRAIWASAVGQHDGLSKFGLTIEKAGNFAQFVTRELRQQALMSRRSDGTTITSNINGLAFDVGANNGDDTAYYLKRGMRVVAVEASPTLAQEMHRRFPDEVQSGRLTILNVAIVPDDKQEIDFFVNDDDDKISTVKPNGTTEGFRPIRIAARRLSDIVREFGIPLYVKLDIEGVDEAALSDLFEAGYKPAYISAEAHSIGTFIQMLRAGYSKFKVVEGRFAHRPRHALTIMNNAGELTYYEFPKGASGPFGDDIPGPWVSPSDMLQYLARHGTGWKDIHASL